MRKGTPRQKRTSTLSFIAKRRLELNLTQQAIADELKVCRVAVTYYENGNRSLPSNFVLPLARVLQCEPVDLLASLK